MWLITWEKEKQRETNFKKRSNTQVIYNVTTMLISRRETNCKDGRKRQDLITQFSAIISPKFGGNVLKEDNFPNK